ncbi:MAG: SH3 domain-containing protein [Candidatus Lindowbacteria bacterium]|nr:SH3 domain-containing protein [Candidatus Lindowbacteria bacterium]
MKKISSQLVLVLFLLTVGSLNLQAAPLVPTPENAAHYVEIDQFIAGLETSEQVLHLVKDPAMRAFLDSDPLTLSFLRERFINSKSAHNDGMSKAFLSWVFQMIISPSNHASSRQDFPQFTLEASESCRSWDRISTRSLSSTKAPSRTSTHSVPSSSQRPIKTVPLKNQAYTKTTPLTAVRLTPETDAYVVGHLPVGSPVTVIGTAGNSLLVEASGLVGFVNSSDVVFATTLKDATAIETTAVLTAPNNTKIQTQTLRQSKTNPQGHWTPWGWSTN